MLVSQKGTKYTKRDNELTDLCVFAGYSYTETL